MRQKIILFVFVQLLLTKTLFGAEQGREAGKKIVRDLSRSYKNLTVQTEQVINIPTKKEQIRILVVGDPAVGKTLLIKKFLNLTIHKSEMPTIALGTYTGSKIIDENPYNITIFETNSSYFHRLIQHARSVDGILVLVSDEQYDSLNPNHLHYWYRHILNVTQLKKPVLFVRNIPGNTSCVNITKKEKEKADTGFKHRVYVDINKGKFIESAFNDLILEILKNKN